MTAASSPGAGGSRAITRRMLRASLVAEAATGVVGAAIGGLVSGGPGAASVAVAYVVVSACLALGILATSALVERAPALALPGAVSLFLVQMFALVVVGAALTDAGWLQRGLFAAGGIAATATWQVAMTLAYRRARQWYVETLPQAPAVRP